MKKILLILLVAVFTLTTVLISACGNNENTGGAESSSSIEEVVSSSVRPSRGSVNPELVSSSTISYEDPNGSMSYTDPNIVSGSTQQGTYVEGDPFTVTSADPNGASINASTVIGYINMIGTVDGSNFLQKGQYIQYARQKYDALTAGEKAEVTNYASLQGAESAYNNFVLTAATESINNLKNAIVTISDFNYDATYESDLAQCVSYYNLIDSAYRNQVANESYIIEAATFHVLLNQMPTVEALTGNDLKKVRTLRTEYNGLSQNAISVYTKHAESGTSVSAYEAKLNSVYTEIIYISIDANGDGILTQTEASEEKLLKAHPFFTLSSTSSAGRDPITFQGITFEKTIKSDISFTAPCGGLLTLYVGNRDGNVTVSVNGTIVGEQTVQKATPSVLEFDVPTGGNVQVSGIASSQAGLYAAIFGYANV